MQYTEEQVQEALAWVDRNYFVNTAEMHIVVLAAALRDSRERQRWIPVSELLPEPWKHVLVYDSCLKEVFVYRIEEESGGLCRLITHWMPLPLPPEEV